MKKTECGTLAYVNTGRISIYDRAACRGSNCGAATLDEAIMKVDLRERDKRRAGNVAVDGEVNVRAAIDYIADGGRVMKFGLHWEIVSVVVAVLDLGPTVLGGRLVDGQKEAKKKETGFEG